MFQVFKFSIWTDGAARKELKYVKERTTNPAAILSPPVTVLNVSDVLFAFVFVCVLY